jgi:hypothetical protein
MMQGVPAFVSLLKAPLGCLYLVRAAVGEMAPSPEGVKRRLREGVEFFPFVRERREVAR